MDVGLRAGLSLGVFAAAATGLAVLGAGVAAASTGDSPAAGGGVASSATAPADRRVPTKQALPAAARRETTPSTVRPAAVTTNQAPVISGVSVRTPNTSTGAVSGTVTASDPERTALTYAATTSPAGRVTITGAGAFTYTPTAAARHAAARIGAGPSATSDTVAVTVTDSGGALARTDVTVPISPRNTAPRFGRNTVGVPEPVSGVVSGRLSATDADRDPLSFSAPASTARGTITIDALTGAFTYTPTADARNTAAQTGAAADKADTFTVTVADGYGGQATAAIKVAISPALRLPEPQYLPVTAQLRVGAEVIGLEVAVTREQQWRGLMGRPPLGPNQGMLFTYSPASPQFFWMWQTPHPIDMVFLLGGEVKTVYAATPCLAQPCQFYGSLLQPVDAVIELGSGRAAQLGLKPGVRVTITSIVPTSIVPPGVISPSGPATVPVSV